MSVFAAYSMKIFSSTMYDGNRGTTGASEIDMAENLIIQNITNTGSADL